MRIARIDVFGFPLTYVHGTYVMSHGREITSLDSTIVRVTTEDGTEGFGEVCPWGQPTCRRTPPGHERRWPR